MFCVHSKPFFLSFCHVAWRGINQYCFNRVLLSNNWFFDFSTVPIGTHFLLILNTHLGSLIRSLVPFIGNTLARTGIATVSTRTLFLFWTLFRTYIDSVQLMTSHITQVHIGQIYRHFGWVRTYVQVSVSYLRGWFKQRFLRYYIVICWYNNQNIFSYCHFAIIF